MFTQSYVDFNTHSTTHASQRSNKYAQFAVHIYAYENMCNKRRENQNKMKGFIFRTNTDRVNNS